jgi:hypothetical protein
MKPVTENIQKWVDALRSGNYKQGRFFLRDGDTYCCLGVLCDIAEVDADWSDKDSVSNGVKMFDGSTTHIPKSVQEWAGITSSSPSIYIEGLDSREFFTVLNDSGDYNFNDIADLIEKEYL